jgi:hypothetical protein
MTSSTMGQEVPSTAALHESHASYISRFNVLLDVHHIKVPIEPKASDGPKIFCSNNSLKGSLDSPENLITLTEHWERTQSTSICIIEGISAEYIAALGSRWSIDPMFFVMYMTNRDQEKLWWGREWNFDQRNLNECSYLEGDYDHMDGIFEYHNESPSSPTLSAFVSPGQTHRHCFKDANWPLQSNTRISYCRLSGYNCRLFQTLSSMCTC